MFSGITITCFAASYTVVLALEISRLLFRSGIRGVVMLGFAGAGFFANTVYLYSQAAARTGHPLSSARDWYLVAAWILVAIYLYLTWYHPKQSFGLFILPLVLGLIAAGTWLAPTTPFPREPAARLWGMVHGASILGATVTILVGFAAGLMYLEQAHRLKKKLPPRRGLRLPSLEWLQRTNGRAIVISVATLALAILSGAVLNRIHAGDVIPSVPWNDPVVLSTGAMFVWLVIASGTYALYRPVREGRRVAYLTVLSFVFLVAVLCAGLFLDTQHGQAKPAAEPESISSVAEEAR